MTERVDARGLSCPQPVLMAISKMREVDSGEIEVLVDNATSKENVTRAGQKSGWELAEINEEGEEYRLLFKRA